MPIRFVCPFGHPLVVPDERAGKRGRCPVCRQRLIIPTPDDNSPALKRLPWKRSWPEEPIAVDGAGAESGGGNGDSSSSDLNLATHESSTDSRAAPRVLAPANLFARLESEQFQFPHDERRAWRARLLAVALLALAIFSAAPAIAYLDGPSTAAWCWIVLASSGVVGVSALAVLWLPDWSTLWITSWISGISTTGYFVMLSTAIVTPLDRPLPIGLEGVRASAAGWSGLMVLITAALCYGSARLSATWRDDYDDARRDWHQRRQSSAFTHAAAAEFASITAPAAQATTPPVGPPR
jgi:hypothetical protein